MHPLIVSGDFIIAKSCSSASFTSKSIVPMENQGVKPIHSSRMGENLLFCAVRYSR